MSLILLTVGCMVKQINFGQTPDNNSVADGKNTTGLDFSVNAIFIFVQTICSCLAGVYNEYLLKHKGADVNIYVQNVFMYLDSIVCNALILILQGNFFSAFTTESLGSVFRFNVIIIMINNAAIGIITSFFLKYMNSILKTFASALELLFTAVLCYILFSIPIYINTVLAIGIVSFAIYLYSKSPVVNTEKSVVDRNKTTEDRVSLINNEDGEIEEV